MTLSTKRGNSQQVFEMKAIKSHEICPNWVSQVTQFQQLLPYWSAYV